MFDSLTVAGWVGSILVGVLTGIVVANRYNKLYKKFRVEIEAVKRQVCEQAADIAGLRYQARELDALKYRMDVFEGKHLRARNLGMGLPQPKGTKDHGDSE